MIVIHNKNNVTHKTDKNLKKVLFVVSSILVLISVIFVLYFVISNFFIDSKEVKEMKKSWEAYDYENVYSISKEILLEDNFNNTALTYNGYAAFFLAVSQIDSTLAQNYLDESINDLRLALMSAKSSIRPQIEYILGKAYFYKNTVSSYYYSDLAIKYLLKAREDGYKADDISEYLGLCYASLGDTKNSISEFSEALLVRESDFLLLSIAEQYNKAGRAQIAIPYLFRIIKSSQNDDIILKSRNLLANIYIENKQYAEAKTELEEILKNNSKSADAYYGLGLIYEKQGDLIKARAEFRKALKAQPNHSGALSKISELR